MIVYLLNGTSPFQGRFKEDLGEPTVDDGNLNTLETIFTF